MKYWVTPSGKVSSLYVNMLKETHLLIGGVTGSGKSVVLNAIIYTALYKSPSDVGLILCDPKMVELSRYEYMPHVMRYSDSLETIELALKDAHGLMMSRFAEMKQNQQTETAKRDIYIIIDEFADLVARGANKAENALKTSCEYYIESIGKLGRAAHVHLILATQAPNRKTLKANIVMNMTATMALRCRYEIESRQLIGTDEAVSLPDPRKEHRAEGIYITGLEKIHCNVPMIPSSEIDSMIEFWNVQTYNQSWTKPKKGGLFSRLFGRNM